MSSLKVRLARLEKYAAERQKYKARLLRYIIENLEDGKRAELSQKLSEVERGERTIDDVRQWFSEDSRKERIDGSSNSTGTE